MFYCNIGFRRNIFGSAVENTASVDFHPAFAKMSSELSLSGKRIDLFELLYVTEW